MREAVLTETQLTLLKQFEGIGGCLKYFLLECEPSLVEDVGSSESHRLAAVHALEIFEQRWADYSKKTSIEKNIPIEKFFVMKIDHQKARTLKGKRITVEDFLGPRYNLENNLLIFKDSWTVFGGYAYAFSDPPHPLYKVALKRRVTEQEATKLFQSINQQILGGINSQSIIYEWPVDWSTFFDPGAEWWGSFLWTFANPGTDRIVVLAASSSD